MKTVGDKLRSVRNLAPLGPSPLGQIYSAKADLKRSYERITFWTLFRSDENTHLVRPHVFVKKKPYTPAQWYAWLGNNLDKIQRENVLPGINRRTGKTYFVERKLGWIGHARKFANSAAVGRKWHPPKSQGKSSQ